MKKKIILFCLTLLSSVMYSQNSGDLDVTFGDNGKVIVNLGNAFHEVLNQTVQSDGKIIVCGRYQNGVTTSGFIARIDNNGDLDTSFSASGIVYNTAALGFTNVTIQTSGKIVVAGYISNRVIVVRYNTDGSVDTTFATNGLFDNTLSSTNQSIRLSDFVKLDDDSMLILTNGNFFIAKLTPSGILDTTFDVDGLLSINLTVGVLRRFTFLLKQADNKFLIYGTYFTDSSLVNKFNFVARFNTNGSLDTSFNSNGYRIIDGFDIGMMQLQTDGKIVVSTTNDSSVNLYRINTNGSLDTNFDSDGLMTIAGTGNNSSKLGIQNDSKILVATRVNVGPETNYDIMVARVNTNGTLDTTFDADGKMIFNYHSLNDFNCGISLDNGKIILTGNSFFDYLTSNLCVAKLNSDGSFDTSFNGDGKTEIFIENQSNDGAQKSILLSDGKLMVFGSTFSANNYFTNPDRSPSIIRINPDGTLDSSFDNDGKLILNQQGIISEAKVLLDNKIILIAESRFGGNSRLIKLNYDGSLDTSFGTNGIATPLLSLNGLLYRNLLIMEDGKIMISGSYNTSSTSFLLLARLNNDGTIDTSFGNNGYVGVLGQNRLDGYNYNPQCLEKTNDGKFIIGGSLDNSGDFYLYRTIVCQLNADGTTDNSFDGDGLFTIDFPTNVIDYMYDMKFQNDGKILAIVNSNNSLDLRNFGLFRITQNGELDATFGTNGIVMTDVGSSESFGLCLNLSAANQDIYAAGRSTITTTDFTLLKYNPNGTLNTNFGTNGIITTDFYNTNEGIASIEITANSLYAIGSSSSLSSNTSNDFAVAKYHSTTLSSADFNTESTIEVYPNPTTGIVYLNKSHSKCQVFSIEGRLITTEFSTGQVDLGDAANGIYLFHLYDSDGNLKIQKVIKK